MYEVIQTSEVRKYTEGHKSHYDKGYRSEAINIVYNSREHFNNATQSFCNKIQTMQINGSLPNDLWGAILAKEMLPKFIQDNNIGIDWIKFNTSDKSPYNLFYEIHSVSGSSDSYAPTILSKEVCKQLPSKLQKGWIAIIREFGLFGVLSTTFSDITVEIYGSDNTLKSEQIKKLIEGRTPNIIFTSNDVTCPAMDIVQDYLGICVALNIGLVKAGIYSKDSHISLLDQDEKRHFRKAEKMFAEYDFKIQSLIA